MAKFDACVSRCENDGLIGFCTVLMLLLSRCGDMRSLDARRSNRAPVEEWQASWPIKAMQVYTVSFYFWSAWAKLRMSAGGERLPSGVYLSEGPRELPRLSPEDRVRRAFPKPRRRARA